MNERIKCEKEQDVESLLRKQEGLATANTKLDSLLLSNSVHVCWE